MATIPSGGPGFGSAVKRKPVKNPTLPDGGGFNRLVMRRAERPDSKNLPGPVNKFGDRIGPGVATNRQTSPTNNKGLAGIMNRNPRFGQKYREGMTASGREVHYYGNQRFVLPKRSGTLKRS